MTTLSVGQLKNMLLTVSGQVIAAKEMLGDADRKIGDGDHGIGMATGFEAVQKELESHEYTDVYTLFSTAGRTMIRVMGGASGIIFGLLFFAGAKNQPPNVEMTPTDLAALFEKALAEIQVKGQAKSGDKTLVDGLTPMVAAMKQSAAGGAGFVDMLAQAAAAAEAGKEDSKRYVAKFGKAKTLGERAVGFPDPGCVSLTVIVNAMSQWAQVNAAKVQS